MSFLGCPGPKIDDSKGVGGPGRLGNPPKRWGAKPCRDKAKMVFNVVFEAARAQKTT